MGENTRSLVNCSKKTDEEVVVILTVGPLGPGNPMLPASPLVWLAVDAYLVRNREITTSN